MCVAAIPVGAVTATADPCLSLSPAMMWVRRKLLPAPNRCLAWQQPWCILMGLCWTLSLTLYTCAWGCMEGEWVRWCGSVTADHDVDIQTPHAMQPARIHACARIPSEEDVSAFHGNVIYLCL